MKQIITCGCGNNIEFDRENGDSKNVLCKKCGAIYISNDKGYIYVG